MKLRRFMAFSIGIIIMVTNTFSVYSSENSKPCDHSGDEQVYDKDHVFGMSEMNNHDASGVSEMDTDYFNPCEKQSIEQYGTYDSSVAEASVDGYGPGSKSCYLGIQSDLLGKVDSGSDTGGAVTEDGTLYTWGSNHYGALGAGINYDDLPDRYNPSVIKKDIKYINFSISPMAISKTGELLVWGLNSGMHGYKPVINNDTTSNCYNSPVKLLDNIRKFYQEYPAYGALSNDGELYIWGPSNLNEDEDDKYIPKIVLSGINEFSIGGGCTGAASTQMVCGAINNSGDLYMWGYNHYGTVGNGVDSYYVKSPTKVLKNVKSVLVSAGSTKAITYSGELYVWGRSGYFEVNSNTPVKVMDNVESLTVSNANDTVMAIITKDHKLYMCGSNYDGQIGNGTRTSLGDTGVKKPTYIMDGVKEISLASSNTMALKDNGDLYSWGFKNGGMIGDGSDVAGVNNDENYVTTPQKIMSGILYAHHSLCNDLAAYAIDRDYDLYTWGSGALGQGFDPHKLDSYNGRSVCFPVRIMNLKGSGTVYDEPKVYDLTETVKKDKEERRLIEIEINGKGTAYGAFLLKDNKGDILKNQDVTYRFDDGTTGHTKSNDKGYAVVSWSTDSSSERLDTGGEPYKKVITADLYLGNSNDISSLTKLNSNLVMDITVNPLSFSQEWKGSCDADFTYKFGPSVEAQPLVAEVEVSLANEEVSGGIGSTLGIKNEYKNGQRNLLLTDKLDGKVSVKAIYGPKGKADALGKGVDFRLIEANVGSRYGASYTLGTKINGYDPNNNDHLMSVGKFLLGTEAISTGNAMLLSIAEALGFDAYNYYGLSDGIGMTAGASIDNIQTGDFEGSVASVKADTAFQKSIVKDELTDSYKYSCKKISGLSENLGDFSLKSEDDKIKSNVLSGKLFDNEYEISSSLNTSADERTVKLSRLMKYSELGANITSTAEKDNCVLTYRGDYLKQIEQDVPKLKRFSGGTPFFAFDSTMRGIWNDAESSSAVADYEFNTSKNSTTTIPLSIGLQAVIGGKGSLTFVGVNSTQYVYEEGTSQSGTLYTEGRSNIDAEVDKRKLELTEILAEPMRVILNKAKDFVSRTWGNIKDGISNGLASAKGTLNDGMNRFVNIVSLKGSAVGAVSGRYIRTFNPKSQGYNADGEVAVGAYGDDIALEKIYMEESLIIGNPYYVYLSNDAEGEDIIENFADTPVALTLGYTDDLFERWGLKPSCEKQLTIYRYSEELPGYVFVGGSVNENDNTVTANITESGQYALILESISEEIKNAENKDVLDGNLITMKIGTTGYKVVYTKSVSFNGVKHIEKGGKTSKAKIGDIEVTLYDKDGKMVSPGLYKLSFKNNKDATGGKTPFFTIKLKGKADKSVKQAFKDTKLEFEIKPLDLGSIKLSPVITDKGGVMIKGLSFVNETGKNVKLKPVSAGKGDYSIEGSINGTAKYVVIKGNGNYTGKVKLSLR